MNGLEALEKIHKNFGLADNFSGDFLRKDIQEEMLEPIEKELKALEIIKEKEVDSGSLLYYIRSSNHPLAFYNKGIVNEKKKLTKDEFDLLKEVLK